MKLDHVGWVTNDLGLFEKFWVDILGFERIFESHIPPEMNGELFDIHYGAYCARYTKGDITLEVHVYDEPITPRELPFNLYGLNHIALHVEDRPGFLKKYDFDKRIYNNPKGWQNIFIRDFEGNWIELRTTL